MQKRLQKTRRLLKLQQKLHEIEKWKLAGLQNRVFEVQEAQTALIETLNDDDALHGLFVEVRAKRMQALAMEEARLKKAQEQQSKIALDKAMKVKRTERLVGRLDVENRRDGEKREYLSLLDALASKLDASLP